MASFSQIFQSFMFQLIFTVGIIVLFGFLISKINKLFYWLVRGKGRAICYVTGVIGTPVHELGHAFFCLIFGHKIIEIKLFQIDSNDGVLGYVRHSYNKKNLWQRIGNFFIGIGPIIFGSAVLFLLAYLLVPSVFTEFLNVMHAAIGTEKNIFINVFYSCGMYIKEFFTGAINGWWWVYLIIGIMIALHMNLSVADIRNSGTGFFFYAGVMLIINLVMGLISVNFLNALDNAFLYAGNFLLSTLILSLLFSLGYLVLALIYYGIKKLVEYGRARKKV